MTDRIGWKRGAIVLGVIAGGVGTYFLVKTIRARRADGGEELEASNGAKKPERREVRRHQSADLH